jgi:Leucine-rich repeat (LRR) protein
MPITYMVHRKTLKFIIFVEIKTTTASEALCVCVSWATLGSSSPDNNCLTAMRILPLATITLFVLNFYNSGADSTLCRAVGYNEVARTFNNYGRLRSVERASIHVVPCPSNETIFHPSNCTLCNLTEIVSCFGEAASLPKPSDLPKKITRFDVSSTLMWFITDAAFYDKEITSIYIHNNKFALINQNAFNGVKNLKYLTLANNRLPHIMVNMFAELKDLATLILDDNNLEVTNSGDFVSVSSILGNQQQSDESNPFRAIQMNSLQYLSLANNPLKQLPKQSLRWLKGSKLNQLSLRGTQLESVHKGELALKFEYLH